MNSSTPSTPVRVRFAPSPTGYLHVGSARTAIFNWLYARNQGGTFILRIEDTDRTRYVPEALSSLMQDLKWLGLDWDEGPGKEGGCGPYYQSERLGLYAEHVRILWDRGRAYPCFCNSERLEKVRAEQKERGALTGYDRHCRDLSDADARKRVADGDAHVMRLKVPLSGSTKFHDEIRGFIEYRNDALDDLVLMKTDGFPTYHLANVVDDHHMSITHVMRGDEWIASTPRHVLLYDAFEWAPPKFVHLPVILAEGGGKLSKRKGAAAVGDYKALGYLPDALVNFLSLLGWSPGEDKEYMDVSELIERFSLEKIQAKSAAFDEKKLEWLNGQYLMKKMPSELRPDFESALVEKGLLEEGADPAYLDRVLGLLQPRVRRVTELPDMAVYFFRDPDSYDEKGARKYFVADVVERISDLESTLSPIENFDAATLEEAYRTLAERTDQKAALYIHPTRLALSGVTYGPGLFEMMEALGKETVLRRLGKAREHVARQ